MLPHPKAQVCCLNFDNKCPILTTLVDHLSCLFSYSMSFLVFDNAYRHFLINTIVENNANNFATAPPPGNPATMVPFTTDFGTWFRDDPNGLDHLDTDMALAFPTLNTATHPDVSISPA